MKISTYYFQFSTYLIVCLCFAINDSDSQTPLNDNQPLWVYEFDNPNWQDDGIVLTTPGDYGQGDFSAGQTMPTGELSDGLGAVATVSNNEGVLLFFPAQAVEEGGVIVRVSVWAVEAGSQVALAALDADHATGLASLDGSIATRVPIQSDVLQGSWHQMALYIDSYKNAVVPAIQVVSVVDGSHTIWLDRLEILSPQDFINTGSGQATDLAVMGIDLVWNSIWPNADNPLKITLANKGGIPSSGFLGRLLVDDIVLGQEMLNPLAPGEQIIIDADWGPDSVGEHILQVDVLPTGDVLDSNLSNNSLRRVVTVADNPGSYIDLVINEANVVNAFIREPALLPAQIIDRPTAPITLKKSLRVNVSNLGQETPMKDAMVKVLFGDGTEQINSAGIIEANSTKVLSFADIPTTTIYPIVITIDPEQQIGESNEDNNEYLYIAPIEPYENPVDTEGIPGPIRRMSKFWEDHGFQPGDLPEEIYHNAYQKKMAIRLPQYSEFDPGRPLANRDFNASAVTETGERLSVQRGSAPGVQSIFGHVGPHAVVEGAARFKQASLSIGLLPEDVQNIDPTTLRLFQYHTNSQSYVLVQPSGLGADGSYVWGLIQEPGIYAAFGLPRDQAKRQLLYGLREFQPLSDMYQSMANQNTPFLENEILKLVLNPTQSQIQQIIKDPEQMNQMGFQDLVGHAQLLEGEIFSAIPRDEKGHPVGFRTILEEAPNRIAPDQVIIDPIDIPFIDLIQVRKRLPGIRKVSELDVPILTKSPVLMPEYQLIDDLEISASIGVQDIQLPSVGGDWKSMGPTNLGGRVKSLAAAPNSSYALYAGVAEGGFSRLIGNWWFPTTDEMPSLSIGAIAVAPSNANVIYVGTGEYWSTKMNIPATSYAGIGVYRSTDNGWHWEVLPVNNNLSNRISKIVVHPNNPNLLYVAGNRGVHRWNQTTQTWVHIATTDTTDLVMHPTNPEILYAGMEDLRGVQRTSNASANNPTWSAMNNGLTLTNHLPHYIKLAISQSNPSILYAHLNRETYNDEKSQWVAVNTRTYRYNGSQWSLIGNDVAGHSQSSWCSFVRVHPTDPNRVFVGGVKLAWTPNAGTNWYQLNGGHADCQDLIFDPLNPNRTILANDGGIWQYTQSPGETTWTYEDFNHGNTSIQFYNVGVSQNGPFTLGGSTQDMGILLTHTSTNYDALWGNEGGIFEVDPSNGNIIYWDPWSGNLHKTTSGSNSGGQEITTGITQIDDKVPSVTALAVHPQDSNLLICSAPAPNNEFAIYRSTDGGEFWQRVHTYTGSAVTKFVWAPSDPFWIYGVTRDGEVLRSTGLGTIWFQKSNNTLPATRLYGVAVDWNNKECVYVTGWSNTTSGVVWKSTDGGENWEDISGPPNEYFGIPDSLGWSIFVEQGKPNTLYVCTEVGVFQTSNGGLWWRRFDKGLPNAVLSDMDYQPHTQTLYVSTIGRGMFKTLLY